MNTEQLERMKYGKGFIAALDQSGGSTPTALANYGIEASQYNSEEQMFDLVHQMRTRMLANDVFNSSRILGAILFKQTMRSKIDNIPTADYLWKTKKIVPFLKIDNGLDDLSDGVQMMKPIPELSSLLDEARGNNIFGTKMRSVIKEYNEASIEKIVNQQFEIADIIIDAGFVPIIEPEVDIKSTDKAKIELYLKIRLEDKIRLMDKKRLIMLKLSIPEQPDFYSSLMELENVVRVVALSGGYSREEANLRLVKQKGLIASFSRALAEGLNVNQTDDEFSQTLDSNIQSIYEASNNK